MHQNRSYSPETLNSGQHRRSLSRATLKLDGWPWKIIGHLFYVASSFVRHSIAICEFKLDLQSRNAQFESKSMVFFLSHVTLKFNRWPWKTIGQLFYTTSSIVHHFKAMGEFKLELQSGTAEFGSKSATSFPCDLEIWQMTLKNNRAPLLDCFKLCASFHRHQCIQTRVVVRKRLIWVKIDDCFSRVTLKFDGWPWKTIGHLS